MREILAQVVANLARNKLRSFLTMAGIAWGVASIVLIVAMGDGFIDGQTKNVRQLGESIVMVFGGRTELQAGGQRAGRRTRPAYEDVRDLRKEAWLVKQVSAELIAETTAASPFNNGTFETHGVEPEFGRMRTIPLEYGRFLNAGDLSDGRRVCIIGFNVRTQLFAKRSGVLNTLIQLNGIPYRIVGMMADKNQNSSYSGRDVDLIFVPYSSMVRDFPPKYEGYIPGHLSNLVYQPLHLDQWEETQWQVRRVLGRNHRFDPADESAAPMWDTIENAQLVASIFESMTAFLGTIAVITLTLGGVGVMNIMLVSVTERTREIGIRKAMGATRHRILMDFLIEGVILAFGSGTVGWAVAWGLASIVNSFPMPDMFGGLPVSQATAALAFGALAVVALTSSLWPAWRAASLTPTEALAYER